MNTKIHTKLRHWSIGLYGFAIIVVGGFLIPQVLSGTYQFPIVDYGIMAGYTVAVLSFLYCCLDGGRLRKLSWVMLGANILLFAAQLYLTAEEIFIVVEDPEIHSELTFAFGVLSDLFFMGTAASAVCIFYIAHELATPDGSRLQYDEGAEGKYTKYLEYAINSIFFWGPVGAVLYLLGITQDGNPPNIPVGSLGLVTALLLFPPTRKYLYKLLKINPPFPKRALLMVILMTVLAYHSNQYSQAERDSKKHWKPSIERQE